MSVFRKSFTRDGEALALSVRPLSDGRYAVQVNDEVTEVEAVLLPDGRLRCNIDGEVYDADCAPCGRDVQVRFHGRTWLLEQSRGRGAAATAGSGVIEAPMTGTVLQVLVEPGTAVEVGQPLVVLSAMKMEHKLAADCNGAVAELNATEGQQVDQGTVLVRIDASDD